MVIHGNCNRIKELRMWSLVDFYTGFKSQGKLDLMPGNTSPRKLLSRKTFLHTQWNNSGNLGNHAYIRSSLLTGSSKWTGTGNMFKKPGPKRPLKRKLGDNTPSSRVVVRGTHVNSNSILASSSSIETEQDEEVITEASFVCVSVCLPVWIIMQFPSICNLLPILHKLSRFLFSKYPVRQLIENLI